MRIAFGAVFAVLPFAFAAVWLWLAEPGAPREARRFGRSVRAAISDEAVSAWAGRIAKAQRAGGENEIDIPRSEWPSELQALLGRNQFATATLCRDREARPLGIRFRDGIVGIVIPFDGVIPDAAYFSIHIVDPTCPYYAYSIYR